jgi:hypothetical protein
MPTEPSDQSFTNIAVSDVARSGDECMSTIAELYRNFRHRALSEPGANAQGGWTLEQDSQRSTKSYYQEVNNPRFWMYVCVQNPGGRVPTSPIERKDALLSGEWVGFAWLYGPLTSEEWSLPTSRPEGETGKSEHLYNGGGTYMVPEMRRIRDSEGQLLITALLNTMYSHMEDYIRRSTQEFPAHFRVHGNITPEGFADGRILKYYRRHLGYVVTGFVPQVTNLVTNNRVLPGNLPSVKSSPEFYSACDYAVIERHAELRRDGTRVLLGVEDQVVEEKALL